MLASRSKVVIIWNFLLLEAGDVYVISAYEQIWYLMRRRWLLERRSPMRRASQHLTVPRQTASDEVVPFQRDPYAISLQSYLSQTDRSKLNWPSPFEFRFSKDIRDLKILVVPSSPSTTSVLSSRSWTKMWTKYYRLVSHYFYSVPSANLPVNGPFGSELIIDLSFGGNCWKVTTRT